MGSRTILTDAGIRGALSRARKRGAALWLSDGAIPRTHGGLQLYADPNGAGRWYWRYSAPDGTKPRLPLGPYSADKAPGALTLAQARARVGELAALYADPATRDVRAYLAREAERAAADAETAERARADAQAAAAEASAATLEALLRAYVAHLEAQRRPSYRDARNMFANHVYKAQAALAATPASAITSRDVVAILRPLTEAGKGRQAGKLRAYMRAAFALATRAELDSAVPAAFLRFKVGANPVTPTATLAQFNRTRERNLSEPELRAYWEALKAEPDDAARDAQMLALLLGGQRPAQLVRALVADVDMHARTLRLQDSKGRRAQPRAHILPLPEAAAPIVQRCLDRSAALKAPWLFSLYGTKPLSAQTLTDRTAAISAALLAAPKARRVVREVFQARDLRRTAETLLARMGVSRDVRAQLQSHGLGGVQARHYDRHDYMPEKAAALAAWAAFLERTPAANVTPLKAGAHAA